MPPFRFASCLAALTLFSLALPTASAQMQGTHIVSSWDDPVKLADGTETVYRYEVSYDYATGETLRRAYDGAVLVETVEMASPSTPFPAEIAEAQRLIQADAQLSRVVSRSNATVDGGFILSGDKLPACAKPARCLQFDLMSEDRLTSYQFVVVDLRTGSIVERDLYPDL